MHPFGSGREYDVAATGGLMENAGPELWGPVKKKILENEGMENEGLSFRGCKTRDFNNQVSELLAGYFNIAARSL